MDRYSVLKGTNRSGVYQELGCSESLSPFFKKIGADSFVLPKETVLNLLTGFTRKDAYFNEKQDNSAPISVRYAPMHLYKLPTMPDTMLPFCALSVNGVERREEIAEGDKRETFYSQTYFLGRELMQKSSGGFCYLDQLFGTKLISGKDTQDYKLGRISIKLDAAPAKVIPAYRPQDKALVMRVLELLYRKKTVILKLEKECSINSRSWELLIQIYGMMQPRLATEYGFSTYSDQKDIEKLTAETSVKLFLVPAEAPVVVQRDDLVLIDLNTEKSFAPLDPAMSEILGKWYALGWDRRRDAMEKLFDDDRLDYTDAAAFLKTSQEFFQSWAALSEWYKAKDNEGTAETLADLRKIKETFPICSIDWCNNVFNSKVPRLLKKGITQETLAAEIGATVCYAKEKKLDLSPEEVEDFKFSRTLDLKDTTNGLYVAANKRRDADWEKVMDAHKERTAKIEAAAVQRIKDLQVAHAQEKQDLSNLHAQELQKKDVAYSQMEQRLTGECRDVKTQLAEEKESRRAEKAVLEGKLRESNDSNLALQDKLSRKEAALSDAAGEIEKLRFAEKNATSALKKEREEHQLTRNSLEQAQEDLRKAERYSSYSGSSDDRPHFLRGLPWWMPLVAMLLVGALLVGAVWLIVSLAGGSDEAEPPVTVETADTTEPTESTTEAPPETEPSTEPTESTTESTEPPTTEEQPDPDYEFSNWTDPEAVHQLQLAFPELQLVETANIEGYCPEQWQDYCAAQVVFTLDEALSEVEVTDEEPTAETDEETEEETTDETEEETAEETDTAPQANYAVLLQGEMPEDEIVFAEPVAMVLQYGENILLVYGSDEMCTTSVQLLNYVLPEEDIAVPEETEENTEETEEETEEETTESVDETENTPIAERFLLRVDAETMVELTPDMISWRNVGLISTNANDLFDGQTAFNSKRLPVLRLDTEETSFYLYDYREEPEKVEQFIEILEKDFTAIAIGDFVLAIQ